MAFEVDAIQTEPDLSVETEQYLTFYLSDEVFAIETRKVMEIIPFARLTQVPLVPPMVRGIINLRGAVVPVIDLQVRFGGNKALADKRTCIVIIDAGAEGHPFQLGLMVDSVVEVMTTPVDHIESPPQFGAAIAHELMRGMVRTDCGFIVVLNPEKAFNLDQLAELVHQDATT